MNRYFARRKDLDVRTAPVADFEVDLLALPAADTAAINESVQRRLPVLAYGSHFFLRQAYLAGCTDFCKDPWTMDEIELRLDAIVSGIAKKHRFAWGEISLAGRSVRIAGEHVLLVWQEATVLRILLDQRGTVVEREALFYALRGRPGEEGSRLIDVHVSSLRKKLVPFLPKDCPFIVSVRGKGYMIDRP